MKGIESRLRITEDRLYQERADRAGKLSEVEDKLLNENAKLQVSLRVCAHGPRLRVLMVLNEFQQIKMNYHRG